MKRKFRFKHTNNWLLIFAILTIILLAGIIVNIINLINSIKLEASLALPISMTVFLALQFIILALFLFNCHYTVSTKYFSYVFALFYKKINYNDILLIREDKNNHMLLVYYKILRKGEELIDYQSISIKHSLYDLFVQELRNNNSAIVYEDFDIYKTSQE